MLTATSVTEEPIQHPLQLTEGESQINNGERVKAYLAEHHCATLREIAEALTISVTTAKKWRTRIQGEDEKKGKSKAKK